MKAVPLKFTEHYTKCAAAEATHVLLQLPGPTGRLMLPVMLRGTREGTPNWT